MMRLLPLLFLALLAFTIQPVEHRPPAANPGMSPRDSPGTTDVWWADLEKGETDAIRALLSLADRREKAVAFLKTKMKPLKITPGAVRALLLKLGNENEKVWRPAFEELEYFDPRLAMDLETLMDRYKESPARKRMVEVMSGKEAGWFGDQEVNFGRSRNGMFYFGTLKSFLRADHKIEDLNRIGATPRRSGPESCAPSHCWSTSAPRRRSPSSGTWPPAIPMPSLPRWPETPSNASESPAASAESPCSAHRSAWRPLLDCGVEEP